MWSPPRCADGPASGNALRKPEDHASHLPSYVLLRLPSYQLAFRTPGISPCSAISRNAMRLRPKVPT